MAKDVIRLRIDYYTHFLKSALVISNNISICTTLKYSLFQISHSLAKLFNFCNLLTMQLVQDLIFFLQCKKNQSIKQKIPNSIGMTKLLFSFHDRNKPHAPTYMAYLDLLDQLLVLVLQIINHSSFCHSNLHGPLCF
jgi:hypothetical protein